MNAPANVSRVLTVVIKFGLGCVYPMVVCMKVSYIIFSTKKTKILFKEEIYGLAILVTNII